MSHRSEVEVFALRAAREYATARGLKLVAAFEDTLSGDVARMQVLRRVRRSFPKVPRAALDELVEEPSASWRIRRTEFVGKPAACPLPLDAIRVEPEFT